MEANIDLYPYTLRSVRMLKKNAASRQYTHNVLTEYGMGNLRSMWIGRITQGGTMSSSIEVSTYHTLGIQTN